jgi:hypothetical protein
MGILDIIQCPHFNSLELTNELQIEEKTGMLEGWNVPSHLGERVRVRGNCKA